VTRARLLASLVLAAALGCDTSKPVPVGFSPKDHVAYFPIESGVHALDCTMCHTDPDTFSTFACTGCHSHEKNATVAAHFSITENFVYAPTACYSCHPTGSAVRFDHTPYFAIREGSKHAGVPCLSCHPNTADRHDVDCLTCHPANPTDAKHAEVKVGPGGYERVSATCLKCHADSKVFRVASHLPFHVGSGFPHFIAKVGCLQCHPNPVYGKPWQQDFTTRSCGGTCHPLSDLTPTHADKPEFKYDNISCLTSGCHTMGTKGG